MTIATLIPSALSVWCRRAFLLFIALLNLWLTVVPASLAQENLLSEPGETFAVERDTLNEQPNPSRSSLGADDISSEKVSQFVRAYLQVVALIESSEGQLQAAETDSDSLQIQQAIESEAYALIQEAGLTPQEYLQLLSLANTDPDFGERIALQLQEAGL